MRRPVTFVAELSSMHKKNKSLLYELMRQAKLAHADYVKVQLGWPKEDSIRYIDDWAPDIARWSRDLDIPWFASIWSQDGLGVAQANGMEVYKVSHQIAQDKEQTPLVANIIATGRVVYVSGELMKAPNVYPIYVHAGEYPTYESHMPKEFNEWYGYSSHAHGLGDKLLACSRGARYIEAHMCLSKSDLWVRDTTFSLTPDEFSDMVKYGTDINRALGHRPT